MMPPPLAAAAEVTLSWKGISAGVLSSNGCVGMGRATCWRMRVRRDSSSVSLNTASVGLALPSAAASELIDVRDVCCLG